MHYPKIFEILMNARKRKETAPRAEEKKNKKRAHRNDHLMSVQ